MQKSTDTRSARTNMILVTMGGADPYDMTAKILDVLSGYQQLRVIAMLGSAAKDIKTIDNMKDRFGGRMEVVVDTNDVRQYMQKCDFAIHAAGSTSWELACLGVPSICYVLAENQLKIAKELEQSGFSTNMGWYSDFSKDKLISVMEQIYLNGDEIKKMSIAGSRLVDGKGASRVRKELEA